MTSKIYSTLFISRTLRKTSPILSHCIEMDISYDAQSLIQFDKIEFISPSTQWLFFYSKTAVDFFLIEKKIDSSLHKYGFFGKATAQHFEATSGITPDYIGSTDAKKVASELELLTDRAPITFMVGKHSLRSVQKQRSITSPWQELIIYDHRSKDKITVSNYECAILTSPMNAELFVHNGGSADHYISIGHTTYNALSKLVSNHSHLIASAPSEEGILKTLVQLMSDR